MRAGAGGGVGVWGKKSKKQERKTKKVTSGGRNFPTFKMTFIIALISYYPNSHGNGNQGVEMTAGSRGGGQRSCLEGWGSLCCDSYCCIVVADFLRCVCI